MDKRKSIKTLHWNANSVIGKNNNICCLIEEEKPDIISINETRTNSTTENYIYEISKLGYFPIIRSRKTIIDGKIQTNEINLNGGGVALLVKDSIAIVKEIELPKETFSIMERASIEIVGATIKIGEKEVTFFSLYNPPETKIDEKLIKFIFDHDNFVLQGDLNAKMSMYESPNRVGKELEDSLRSRNHIILNQRNEPTFYRYIFGQLSSMSTLDYVITNENLSQSTTLEIRKMSAVVDSLNETTRPSYFHLPLVGTFKFNERPKKQRTSYNGSYLYERANWKKIIENIEEKLDNSSNQDKNLEALNDDIMRILKDEIEYNVPKSKESLKRTFNYPANIVQALEIRNFWGKVFRQTRSEIFAKKYRQTQNVATEMIGKFKLENWQQFLRRQGKIPMSSAPFWKRINRLRENKRRKSINSMYINNLNVTDKKTIADAFADNLETKFRSDDNERYHNEHKVNIENYLENNFESSYTQAQKSVPEFTMKELETALKGMNTKRSLDPLGLSNNILKTVIGGSKKIKTEILCLFNKCLKESQVPQNWKTSVISMLNKPGLDKSSIDSYRPISSTPCIARLYERLVLARLHDHLKKNNLIITQQSGFRKQRQTRDNLFHLIQTTQQGFNTQKKTLSVFFDIAGAFDKVWHNGLLYKLHIMKVPYYLIKTIADFLRGRTFRVKIDEVLSNEKRIEC